MERVTGNIYGPDDEKPEGVELIEIERDYYEALRAERQRDVEEAIRRVAQRQTNPGRS